MPHVLAVDWDQDQARYVLGVISGRRVRVRALGSHDFAANEGNSEAVDQAFGLWIKGVLKKHAARHCRLLIGVPRSSVELLYMNLPPATDAELPEMVANQAMQESATITEDTILDFVVSEGPADQPRRVTVAALPQSELQLVRNRCAAAGLKAQRVVFRPLASTSLFRRLVSGARRACLIVGRVGREVDLNIVSQGRLMFTRTIQLPAQISGEDLADRLATEIQRTILAAPREQLGDQAIERIYLIGGTADYEMVIEQFDGQDTIDVMVLDPFALTGVTEARVPPDRGRFAPLLGMLLDEAVRAHPVDFLHPRRPVKPVPRWRIALAVAGMIAVLGLGLTFHVWSQLAEVNDVNQGLRRQLGELNATARKAVEQRKRIEAIAAWRSRDANWLEELRDLSQRFPSGRDAVLLRMTMRPSQTRGGIIDMQGLVRDPNIVANMEGSIRDPFRSVRSRRLSQRAVDEDYTWTFETSISVAPRRPDQYPGARSDVAAAESPPQPEETAPTALIAEKPTDEASP
jgi:Tfp pilus assembly PilM family ATPase